MPLNNKTSTKVSRKALKRNDHRAELKSKPIVTTSKPLVSYEAYSSESDQSSLTPEIGSTKKKTKDSIHKVLKNGESAKKKSKKRSAENSPLLRLSDLKTSHRNNPELNKVKKRAKHIKDLPNQEKSSSAKKRAVKVKYRSPTRSPVVKAKSYKSKSRNSSSHKRRNSSTGSYSDTNSSVSPKPNIKDKKSGSKMNASAHHGSHRPGYDNGRPYDDNRGHRSGNGDYMMDKNRSYNSRDAHHRGEPHINHRGRSDEWSGHHSGERYMHSPTRQFPPQHPSHHRQLSPEYIRDRDYSHRPTVPIIRRSLTPPEFRNRGRSPRSSYPDRPVSYERSPQQSSAAFFSKDRDDRHMFGALPVLNQSRLVD